MTIAVYEIDEVDDPALAEASIAAMSMPRRGRFDRAHWQIDLLINGKGWSQTKTSSRSYTAVIIRRGAREAPATVSGCVERAPATRL